MNLLSKESISLQQAIFENQRYGTPIPDHLKVEIAAMKPVQGSETPRQFPLGQKYQWAKPFYMKAGKGHTGDGNPMHGTVSNKARI